MPNTYSRILHIHTYTHANVHTQEEQDGCAWGIFLMTLPCVVHDSFFVLRETSCIHSNEAHSDTVNSWFRTLTSIVYIRGMTHLWVWHEIGKWEIHPYPGHDSFWCWALRVEFLFLWFEFSRLMHLWVKERIHNPIDDHFKDNDRKQEFIYWDFLYFS